MSMLHARCVFSSFIGWIRPYDLLPAEQKGNVSVSFVESRNDDRAWVDSDLFVKGCIAYRWSFVSVSV